MAARVDLPAQVALFPLAGVILLPRTRLPLQIFEPRYLQMIEDALATPQRLIGIIQAAQPGAPRLMQIGCSGRIVSFTELEDRRLMISLRAQSRFRLVRVDHESKPYRVAQVDWRGFEADLNPRPESVEGLDRAGLMDRLMRYAELRGLASDWNAVRDTDEETLVNSLSMLLPFPPEEKQALLESPTLADRRELLDGLLEFALRGGDDEEMMQ